MTAVRTKMDDRGRLTIPLELRGLLTLSSEPGDEIVAIEEGGELRLTTRHRLLERAKGSWGKVGPSADELISERHRSAAERYSRYEAEERRP